MFLLLHRYLTKDFWLNDACLNSGILISNVHSFSLINSPCRLGFSLFSKLSILLKRFLGQFEMSFDLNCSEVSAHMSQDKQNISQKPQNNFICFLSYYINFNIRTSGAVGKNQGWVMSYVARWIGCLEPESENN